MRPLRIAPSVLAADTGHLARELSRVEKAGADLIHVDVMDGHFVPNLAFGIDSLRDMRRYTSLPLDVHLMVDRPMDFMEPFVRAGADMISFHLEACHTPLRALERLKELGVRAGIAIAPATPAGLLDELLETADYVLLLCVEPGFGGQSFRRPVMEKVRSLRRSIEERGLTVSLEVDGGIAPSTIGEAASAGADIFVVGSAVFGLEDYDSGITGLRALAASPTVS